jgi:hypothetical protein
MPKLKLYVFLSIFQILLNLGVFLMNCINNNSLDLLTFFGTVGTSFIPFSSLFPLLFTGLDIDVTALAFIGIFTGIISGLQTYLIAEIILSHIPLVDV